MSGACFGLWELRVPGSPTGPSIWHYPIRQRLNNGDSADLQHYIYFYHLPWCKVRRIHRTAMQYYTIKYITLLGVFGAGSRDEAI